MIDIMIFENGSGGDFSLKNGDLETIEGWTNQPYLALFGGDIEGNTTGEEIEGEERFDWWGNSYLLNEPEAQMNSDFERALNLIEVSSAWNYRITKIS